MKLPGKNMLFLTASIALSIFLELFAFKLLAKTMAKRLKSKTGLFIKIHKPVLKSLNRLAFSSVYIKSEKFSVILKNGSIDFSLRLLFRKKPVITVIKKFNLFEAFIFIYPLSKSKNGEAELNSERRFDFEKRYYFLFRKSLGKLGCFITAGSINNLVILMTTYHQKTRFTLRNFRTSHRSFSGIGELKIKDYVISIPFSLLKDEVSRQIEISNQDMSNEAILTNKDMPVLRITGYKISFKEEDAFNYCLTGNLNAINISSRYVSSFPKEVKSVKFEMFLLFTEEMLKLHKESGFEMDGISVIIECHHSTTDNDLIKFLIVFLVDGNTFFSEFPFFSKKEIQHINASGDLALKLNYMTSLADLTQYYFSSEIVQNTLRINETNRFDLSDLSIDNLQQVRLSKQIAKSVIFKEKLSLCQIPEYLTKTTITAEDPNFYNHRGVDSYFIGMAIAKNVLSRKYVKGASTITMQLARNLFLTHDKNLERKFEEIVLALLMENYFKISKDTILEIYLNIIEFGEGIYGIQEASAFYFDKNVTDLSVTECIVLTYIIPRPKYFLEAVLIKSPKLLYNLRNHIMFHASALLQKKLINEDNFRDINYCIEFTPSIGTLRLK